MPNPVQRNEIITPLIALLFHLSLSVLPLLLLPVPDAESRGAEFAPVDPPLEHGVDGALSHGRAGDAVGAAVVEAARAAAGYLTS